MDPSLASDDELMAALRAEARLHAPPSSFREVARAAFDVRTLDVELAALLEDSALVEEGVAGGVRHGGPAARTCAFAVGRGTVDLHMEEHAVAGQLSDELATITLCTPAGETAVAVDEGAFALRPAPTGPFFLRFGFTDGRAPVATEWLSL